MLRLGTVLVATCLASGCMPCESFRYSNCPERRCVAVCRSSACGGEGEDRMCTSDCDGEGSCVSPGERDES